MSSPCGDTIWATEMASLVMSDFCQKVDEKPRGGMILSLMDLPSQVWRHLLGGKVMSATTRSEKLLSGFQDSWKPAWASYHPH